MFTNKKREGINRFVCDVSLYVAETPKASIKYHKPPLPIIPFGIVAYGFVGQPFSKQLYIDLAKPKSGGPESKTITIKGKKKRICFSWIRNLQIWLIMKALGSPLACWSSAIMRLMSYCSGTVTWLPFNNYSPKAKWILSNNPRDEVEGIIRQYSLSLRRIIVLV